MQSAPRLHGLDSVVAALDHRLPGGGGPGPCPGPVKETVTSSDALTAARRRVWAGGVVPQAEVEGAIAELPANVRELLRSGLAPAP